ncbi:Microcephalin, partial [Nibea albiflora]
ACGLRLFNVSADVVAYVDVWSSDKTANYSNPFVQQLQEMGAQVSKTFNKQVTHVVFSNGHPATWRKAKKSDVRLVSVLWVGRCYDDGVRVDEDLFPAIDETNPVLKNKKVITDVSPIIIDEENGIVYSPALKRSDYMAQRLKDMKEKRENLSPTDESDDDSSASVAEPAYSPDKEEGRTQCDVTDHGHLGQRHRKTSEKPWMSPCRDVPKRISSPLKCPDFNDEGDVAESKSKKSRRSSVKKKPAEKRKSVVLLGSPLPDRKSDTSKKEKRQSQIKSSSPSPNKYEKGKQKMKAAKSFTETKTHCEPTVNSTSCLPSSAKLGSSTVELSKETFTSFQKMEQKIPKPARQSLSALVRSCTLSGDSKSVASCSTDGDDNVFEDYFSPANHPQKSKRPLLPNLPVETDIQIPFELASGPKKRKQRRSESIGTDTNIKKKKKLEGSQSDKNVNQQFDEGNQPQRHPQQGDGPSANVTLMAKRRRQSTLPFTSISTISDAVKRRRASTSVRSTTLTEAIRVSELQKDTDIIALSDTLESRGNECTVAAGLTEIPSEGEENHNNKQVSLSLQKMVNTTKAMRTLVTTSMPTEQQHTVGQVVKTLGGFAVVDRVCESTTHVVSGGQRRTLNILLGIARGCWILSFEWILWCLEQRQWIPEEPYELSDQFPAAQICRLQRHLSAGEHQQDLFQSQPPMFVSQHSQPPTQSLVELIQLCGGTVCKTVRQAGICIGRYNGRRPEGSRILSEQWVLDSITHLKQLSYDNYDLE